jgi:adenylosuccinate synthase
MDKTGRNGLRVGDLELPDLMDRYRALVRKARAFPGLYTAAARRTKKPNSEWLAAVEAAFHAVGG